MELLLMRIQAKTVHKDENNKTIQIGRREGTLQ